MLSILSTILVVMHCSLQQLKGMRKLVVSFFVEDFRGVNEVNSIGSSVLHLAAGNDHVQICRDILACPRFNLGINAQNKNGHTALDFSVQFGGGVAAYVLKAAGGLRGGAVSRKRVVIPPSNPMAEENASCGSDL